MIIIKIGGGSDINVDGIISNIQKLDTDRILIVHGANALRDELAEKVGYEKQVITSVSGYTSVYSDKELIDIMLMSYSGLRNKRIVEGLQKQRINAIGLSGIDGGLIKGQANRGIRAMVGGKKKIIRDFSGKPRQINTDLINLLLSNNYTPVITVPIMDKDGGLINSENDEIIATLCAQYDRVDQVIMFIGEKGLLKDYDDKDSVIDKVDNSFLEKMENLVEGRMKRKLHAISKMIENKTTTVKICDGRSDDPIEEILMDRGTTIFY